MKEAYRNCAAALAFFASAFAHASGEHELAKAKAFLAKNPKCNLAVGQLRGPGKIASRIYCISDMSFGTGSINETKGCTFSEYDLDEDRYFAPYGESSLNKRFPSAKQTCAAGGVYDLLEKKAYINDASNRDRDFSVMHVLLFGPEEREKGSKPKAKTVLIYLSGPGYKSIWDRIE
jgi:hypothetical protein